MENLEASLVASLTAPNQQEAARKVGDQIVNNLTQTTVLPSLKEAKIDGSQLYVKAAAKPTLKAPTFDVKVSATVISEQPESKNIAPPVFGW